MSEAVSCNIGHTNMSSQKCVLKLKCCISYKQLQMISLHEHDSIGALETHSSREAMLLAATV
jgi:hypothetical protein